MPGTTRYSATFDRTYEEDDDEHCPAEAPVTRRSRSQSLQVGSSAGNGCYRPLANLHSRSPSLDKSQIVPKGAEVIPTRTAGKATVKAHNNPFQFVKMNTAPLQQKAEQLKKLQQVKKPPVVKEDEEEWQSNLDSWKSRRRKMSETAIRRQEELKQLKDDSLTQSTQQKKTKTFSEMVEQRAHRGRALSLCLFSNPLESSEWIFEASKSIANRVRSQDPLSGESAESSTMNSEDDNDSYTKLEDDENKNGFYNVNNKKSHLTNGHGLNGIENSASNSSVSRTSELSESEASQNCLPMKERNGVYIDSGLESLSSSHRTGDIPDSGSDFSHDSGSSLDCDSPRVSTLITTGMELLEEFSSKDEEPNVSKTIAQKQDNILSNLTCNSSHPVLSSSSSSSSSENTNNIPKSKVKKVPKKETILTKTVNQKASPNGTVNVNNVKLSPSNSFTKKSVESKNEVLVNNFKELEKSKNPQTKKSAAVKSLPSLSALNPVNSSLNVVYNSNNEEKSIKKPLQNTKSDDSTSSKSSSNFSLIGEVPVEKITEEMERLILEQLEEEEKAKEMPSIESTSEFVIPDDKSDLDTPSKHPEPPKEKPPPPPPLSSNSSDPQNGNSLHRVNSTKRIKKEINRRRSDFLGIDSTIEHDESKTTLNNNEVKNTEEERINQLKEERRLEEERLIAEEQKARLEEARLLQQREEYIRKQEVANDIVASPPKLSSSSSSTDAPKAVLSSTDNLIGDGKNNKDNNISSALVTDVSDTKVVPPTTPPKPPPKKKEAIRKERERLRQEQEALQREREEHRQKVQREQEQQKKNAQNSHVPDPPVPRVGPPIPAKPTQLTPSSIISQVQEGSYNNPSLSCRDPVGNQTTGNQGLPATRQPRNAVARTKARVQQKIPCVRKQPEPLSEMRYNQNHWLIQEAEMRRIAEQKERQRNNETRFISANQVSYHQKPFLDDYRQNPVPRPANLPLSSNQNSSSYAVPAQLHSPDQHWTYSNVPHRNGLPHPLLNMDNVGFPRPVEHLPGSVKPSKGIPLERQEQMLSVSGRKRCSHCGEELGRGAAMIIESLQLYYHIQCFQCCVCQAQLGNGTCGTDVRVRNNKLHCHNCYSNDEAGLKFSQV